MPGTLGRLPVPNRRKVGMTSSHHAPYVQGCTHATMRGTEGCDPVRGSESQKAALSSVRGLLPDLVTSESLVIAYQQCRDEYGYWPCPQRSSHQETEQHPNPITQHSRKAP